MIRRSLSTHFSNGSVLLLLLATAARADVTGSLLGVVRDASSAVVPGAHIVATNTETNLSQGVYSDSAGEYRILALPVGKYRIEVSAQGFQTFLVSNIVLDVDQQHEVDITLQVGSIEQHVAVSATAVAVETSSTQPADYK